VKQNREKDSYKIWPKRKKNGRDRIKINQEGE